MERGHFEVALHGVRIGVMAISPVGTAVVFDSGTSNIPTGGRSVSVSPTAGNTLVVVCFMRGSTSSSLTVTGATFTNRLAQLGNSTYLHIQTAVNVGSGITSIVVAPNVAARGDIWVREYSGVDNSTPMDVTPSGAALPNSSTLSPPALTPVTNGGVVISTWASTAVFNSSSPYPSASAGPTAHTGTKAGSGWTPEYNKWSNVGTNHGLVVGSNVVNDISGSYQGDWTPVLAAAAVGGSIILRPASTLNPQFFTMF